MKFTDYSLKMGDKVLIENLNISFNQNVINHLLGSNGVGKSCFAKSCIGMVKYSGKIEADDDIVLLGSDSNVPLDFSLKDIVKILKNKFSDKQVDELYELLKLKNVPQKLCIKKMSDGQKQKIKLLSFLSAKPRIIILDEFTSALDKSSSLDIYGFLKEYAGNNGVTSINITHNLSDIEYMPGIYYYFSNKNIVRINTKEELFDLYVKGRSV